MGDWRRDILTVMRGPKVSQVSMKELLYNFGVANVLVLRKWRRQLGRSLC